MTAQARVDEQTARLENLLVMGQRLAAAVEGDIVALEHGAFDALKTTDPEIAKLSMLYARDVAALKAAGGVRQGPAPLIAALKETGVRLKNALTLHERLVAAMRQTTEGLVLAVAEELEKNRKQTVPYNPQSEAKRGTPGAILCNRVV